MVVDYVYRDTVAIDRECTTIVCSSPHVMASTEYKESQFCVELARSAEAWLGPECTQASGQGLGLLPQRTYAREKVILIGDECRSLRLGSACSGFAIGSAHAQV